MVVVRPVRHDGVLTKLANGGGVGVCHSSAHEPHGLRGDFGPDGAGGSASSSGGGGRGPVEDTTGRERGHPELS